MQYVPSLAHNLLSVGQLLANGCSVAFEGDQCSIKDVATGMQILVIQKNEKKIFY